MSNTRTAQQIFDREYMELRAKLLELGASFDRISRAHGTTDERMELIAQGLEILSDDQTGKAKRIQTLFSRQYSPNWRKQFEL